ncbi:AraC family transcriptional regulator [Niastella yeongjuensis]|uniref:AraC family transcriptional regulator n=1 Tax=Niastella yeongjuensis TaxID=354355 RepID=A0A1V9E4N5_9BACT|nr:helix-turn-helix transcriptional regulator [Niastella yeongjuensis]OQP41087.1 AraC family transcriptional regulator [Niastella yeongjuensis]SEO92549.1 Helix-turn-helix domain-containing protein [Niastella yeongjuensis]
MKKESPYIFNSISELHRALGLPKPLHPLISLVDYKDIVADTSAISKGMVLNFYKISFKTNFKGKIKYGQRYYDFDEGGLSFISPNQVIGETSEEADYSGYTLLIHPDFIRNHSLGQQIKNYGFFTYATNEALYPSAKEKEIIIGVFRNIEYELNQHIDHFSQDVLIAHIEVLLNYSKRFYNRQFVTRSQANTDQLTQFEELLNDYFNDATALMTGLPSVTFFAEQLHCSPRYLSDMLRSLTGQNTQQHIHARLIEKAKELLSTTNLSIGEIAYQLGFEHSQSFNKLFKQKTDSSPVEFRKSFN